MSKPIEELKKEYPKAFLAYPKDISEYFSSEYSINIADYGPLLQLFGNILLQVDDEDYSGDSRIIYEFPDGTYGYLQFGWGSCSGCDALQSCSTPYEVEELINELQSSIIHFESAKEGLEYFTKHDWEGDYSWCNEEQKEFVKKAIKLFRSLVRKEKSRAKNNHGKKGKKES